MTLRRPYLNRGQLHGAISAVDPFIALYEARLQSMRVKSVKRTTLMLANSRFTRDVIQREYGVEADVCYMGINSTDFSQDVCVPRQGHVLSVGELSARKGFDFLIESLAHIPAARRPILHLACNNEAHFERNFIVRLAAQRGVTLDIYMRLNTGQLVDAYQRAAFVVYAPVMEAFGLVPLEAMACGTAVIGVREGGVCETVVHNETGLLVERDARSFARAIESLLDDGPRCDRYGRQGRAVVTERWSWDDSAQKIEEALAKVAQGSS